MNPEVEPVLEDRVAAGEHVAQLIASQWGVGRDRIELGVLAGDENRLDVVGEPDVDLRRGDGGGDCEIVLDDGYAAGKDASPASTIATRLRTIAAKTSSSPGLLASDLSRSGSRQLLIASAAAVSMIAEPTIS